MNLMQGSAHLQDASTMTIDALCTQRIGILGWGVNHQAVTRWLIEHGAPNVVVLDEYLDDAARDPALAVREWRFGPTAFERLGDFDLVLRSPGIPLSHPQLAIARRAGVAISSQTKLFFDLCRAPIIGVTGTNGKGTTASLIHAMFGAESRKRRTARQPFGTPYLAGNIGRDPFEFLDDVTSNDWVVLELSSFQLEDLTRSPHVAVVLSVTPDHLGASLNHPNYHRSLSDYHAAKRNIVAHQTSQDYAVLHADDPVSASFAEATAAAIRWYSRTEPVRAGVQVREQAGARVFERVDERGAVSLLPVEDLRLRGPHNWENLAAAMTAASAVGVSDDSMIHVARTFRPLPNRMENLGDVNNVTFVNDSYATSPIPAIAAVRSFHEPLVLLLGGQGKGAEYADLIDTIVSGSVRAAVCYGVEGEQFQQRLRQAQFSGQLVYERLFDDAFAAAVNVAEPGNIVLLSPAATSYDQFRSYTERGDHFRHLVEGLRRGA